MSSQVLKISSGEVIQVRTGVIQGIGPQGPIGPSGGQGEAGPQGPQGVPGPQGQVSEFSLEANALSTSIASDLTGTLATFSSVVRDEVLGVVSGTTFQLAPGAWQGMVYITFSKQSGVNATGSRRVSATYKGNWVASLCIAAAPTYPSGLTLPFSVLSTSSTDQIQFTVQQDEGVTLQYNGRLWISRTGPGPQGVAGPQGSLGPIGPPGPQGPTGPAGTIGTNNTTFAAIGG